MATKTMKKVFLSASIPLPERDPQYVKTADVFAIRDAVAALAKIVIPEANLVWGGHPSITPLIRYVLAKTNVPVHDHVSLYQSNFFRDSFPEDNDAFESIFLVETMDDRESSILKMREEMICKNQFCAGVFIGGMDGVVDEFNMFKEAHPEAILLPIASTGAAALQIYEADRAKFSIKLKESFAYFSLFDDFLMEVING